MDETNLCDSWRVCNEDTRQYTWHRFRPTFSFSRLDMMLINVGLMACVDIVKHSPGYKSDHSFVEILWYLIKEIVHCLQTKLTTYFR